MEHQQQLCNYIYQQIQSGVHPHEVAQQLRTAGWDEPSIQQAFSVVQSWIAPVAPQAPAPNSTAGNPAGQTQVASRDQNQAAAAQPLAYQESTRPAGYAPSGAKRGRLKTAWLLMKQSFRVLTINKQLIKYPLMAGIFSLLLALIFIAVIVLAKDAFVYEAEDAFGDGTFHFTPLGMAAGFVYYVLVFFAINFYNAALTAHVLDIFRGTSGTYKSYLKRAWAKKTQLFVYTLITASVGIILQAIEQRSRILGWIVSRFLGALWSLANLFTVPIIVESDSSASSAIKQSTKLFVSRWGENIAGRIGFGGIVFLLYLLCIFPVFYVLLMLGSLAGTYGFIAALVVLLVLSVLVVAVEVAASSILNAALYVYARYQQIPAAFDADLLNGAFRQKKRRWFGRK